MSGITSRKALGVNLMLGFLFVAAAVSIVFLIHTHERNNALENARQRALIILERNFATHAYFTQQLKPAVFELAGSMLDGGYFDPRWMSSTFAVKSIDRMCGDIGDAGSHYYKEAAVNARTEENEADDIEREFIEELNKTHELMERSEVRAIGGEPYYVVMRRGEAMENACLMCHGEPERAPSDMIAYYGAERGFNRGVGRTVSALSIRVPLSDAYGRVDALTWKLSKMLLPVLLLVFAVQYLATNALMKANRALGREIAARAHAEEELRNLAATDELTGIANRRTGLLFLEKQIQLSRRTGSSLTVCYADVDNLKEVNDEYGHIEGDRLILHASALMKGALRESDLICRMGGDEFLLIFPRCSTGEAGEIMGRIERHLADFNGKRMKPYRVNLSYGFAESAPGKEKSADELISAADNEMYRRKTSVQKESRPRS